MGPFDPWIVTGNVDSSRDVLVCTAMVAVSVGVAFLGACVFGSYTSLPCDCYIGGM